MIYHSLIEQRGSVSFPEYTGERVYMEPFFQKHGLPQHLARWQQTVDAMLDGIASDQPIYLMIDQSPVSTGSSQRRPGLHIDGYWNAGVGRHGGHHAISAHGSTPGHRSIPVPVRHAPLSPSHRSTPRHGSRVDRWEDASFEAPEGILLASTITAARGLIGSFDGPIHAGGDCSHIDISHMREIEMRAGQVYAGNVTSLHESLPVTADCVRTLVRLNVPGWTPTIH